jgi:hypothetical protein
MMDFEDSYAVRLSSVSEYLIIGVKRIDSLQVLHLKLCRATLAVGMIKRTGSVHKSHTEVISVPHRGEKCATQR